MEQGLDEGGNQQAKKKKAPLPELVKNELRLAHAKAFGVQQCLNFEMSWKIFNTGELMSCFTDVIAVCGDSNDIGLLSIFYGDQHVVRIFNLATLESSCSKLLPCGS